jgi:hypothetical protein
MFSIRNEDDDGPALRVGRRTSSCENSLTINTDLLSESRKVLELGVDRLRDHAGALLVGVDSLTPGFFAGARLWSKLPDSHCAWSDSSCIVLGDAPPPGPRRLVVAAAAATCAVLRNKTDSRCSSIMTSILVSPGDTMSNPSAAPQ